MKKPAAGTARRRTGQAWAAIVARYRESGLSQRAFAEPEGISVERLRGWLAKLNH